MTALSREGRNGLRNVHREIELAEKKVAAWLIMNDSIKNDEACGEHSGRRRGSVSGKIIVRYTKKASIVSVLFYGTDNAPAIGATEAMTGCGYDRTALGISMALWRLRAELAKWRGINFGCSETAMLNQWDKELEKNGYTVIRVL